MKASGYERVVHDWYQEPPETVEALLEVESFSEPVWDPACGGGNIPIVCAKAGMDVRGTDLVDRRQQGEPPFPFRTHDFLRDRLPFEVGGIISNPPYNVLEEWIDRCLNSTPGKVAILARLAFLEGQKRQTWWERVPLARVWVSSKRISMPPGGSGIVAKGGTVAFAWFVFDRTHAGPAHIQWL